MQQAGVQQKVQHGGRRGLQGPEVVNKILPRDAVGSVAVVAVQVFIWSGVLLFAITPKLT